jgi:hypothetical protein
MFTVEFESDASVITSLDETDRCEDVQMILTDESIVYLRQFEEGIEEHQLITITYQQLLDLYASLKSKEGAYYVKHKGNFNGP